MTTGSFERPEERPLTRDQHQANRGTLVFAEQHPYDPLEDEATRAVTHQGGLGDARTELY